MIRRFGNLTSEEKFIVCSAIITLVFVYVVASFSWVG